MGEYAERLQREIALQNQMAYRYPLVQVTAQASRPKCRLKDCDNDQCDEYDHRNFCAYHRANLRSWIGK